LHLTPRERERLLLAAAADLARRRLARGAPLGSTEAVALVCDEICELAWDGVLLAAVIERARTVIPPAALLPGVAGLVPVIEVEALFPWGSTLVHVDAPFGTGQPYRHPRDDAERGQLTPAPPGSHAPGAVLASTGTIELAPGAVRRTAWLHNTGPRDLWISSRSIRSTRPSGCGWRARQRLISSGMKRRRPGPRVTETGRPARCGGAAWTCPRARPCCCGPDSSGR